MKGWAEKKEFVRKSTNSFVPSRLTVCYGTLDLTFRCCKLTVLLLYGVDLLRGWRKAAVAVVTVKLRWRLSSSTDGPSKRRIEYNDTGSSGKICVYEILAARCRELFDCDRDCYSARLGLAFVIPGRWVAACINNGSSTIPLAIFRSDMWGWLRSCLIPLELLTKFTHLFVSTVLLDSSNFVRFVMQVVGSESGGIYTTPLHFRNSGVVEVSLMPSNKRRWLNVKITS